MPHAIEAHGLRKTFVKARSIREIVTSPLGRAERVQALQGVDLHVESGEIVALLGPNGAGKTTLLKILSCLVLPDEGRALVGGFDTEDERRVKPLIGLVHSDERSFYWRLSARENLRFFARLYDVPGKRIESRIQELLQRVDLVDAADRPFSGYSSGMKQRVAIARALLHDPPILLMDEPTRSLDPASAMGLRGFITDELKGADGKAILIATHDLREAEAIADRVAILVRGRVRQLGTVSEVRRWGVQGQTYRLEIDTTEGLAGAPFEILDESEAGDARRLHVRLHEGATLDDVLHTLIASGIRIRGCDRIVPELEEAFSRILRAEADEPS